jgi:hypothetical protein
MEPHVDRNLISNSNTAFTQLANSFQDSPQQAQHVRATDKLIYIHDKVGNSKWAAIKDFFSSRSARRREGLEAVKKALIDQYGNDVAEKALAKQGLQNAKGIKVNALATLVKHATDIQKQSTEYDLHSKTLGVDENELQAFRDAGFSAEQTNAVMEKFKGTSDSAVGGLRKLIRDTYPDVARPKALNGNTVETVRERLYSESYARTNEKKQLGKTEYKDYFEALAAIQKARPANSKISFQGKNQFHDVSFTDTQANIDRGIANILHSGFYHFSAPGAGNSVRPDQVRERIYLNVAAEHAATVMKDIVSEVVDQPGNFPGVYSAKISGAGAVGQRRDAIVIYVDNENHRNKVLEHLKSKYANSPEYFASDPPPMTQSVSRGISSGQEPTAVRLQSSDPKQWTFGSVRCHAVATAMLRTAGQETKPEETLNAYLENLVKAFGDYKISVTNPAENIP